MREYKFRGKRIDNGEWVYGDLVHLSYKTYIKDSNDKYTNPRTLNGFNHTADVRCVEVDPKTVGQYAGLHDKNGNELWESDIIENEYKERYLIMWDGTGFKAALEGSKKAIYSVNEHWFKSCKKRGELWNIEKWNC